MLQSVVNMDLPLHAVVNLHPEDIKDKQGEVKPIIENRQFWAGAEVLSSLLVPFSQVVMAIQAKSATVADVTRYWLYLARSFKAELPKLTHAGGETFWSDDTCPGSEPSTLYWCENVAEMQCLFCHMPVQIFRSIA